MQLVVTSALVVLCLFSVGISVVSLIIANKALSVSPAEATNLVRTLAHDVTELFDRVDHWQRRDRVRNLRESKATVVEAPPQPGSPEYKQFLRTRVHLTHNGGAQ